MGDQLFSNQPVGDRLFSDQLFSDQLFSDQLINFKIFGDQHLGDQRLCDQLITLTSDHQIILGWSRLVIGRSHNLQDPYFVSYP